jgi:hypothetical protein
MMVSGLRVAVTLGEVVLPVALVAGLVCLALVGLYLLKRKAGSQGWRVRVPRGIQRAFTFLVWLVCKKVPWKPLLIWGPWVAMIYRSQAGRDTALVFGGGEPDRRRGRPGGADRRSRLGVATDPDGRAE